MSETWEDKPLPKGVSPCALQLNRHYAETGTMPQHLPEVAPPPTSSPVLVKPPPAVTSVVTSPVRTSRVMLNPAKKIVGRASRLALRSSRLSPQNARSAQTSVMDTPPPPSLPPATLEAAVDSQDKEKQSKVQGVQGAITLESLVEMLKVVQKFPAGSNLYTSVLQLVEKLIKSMKDNIASQCKVEVEEEVQEEDAAATFTPSDRGVNNSLPTNKPPAGQYLLNKGQKMVSGPVFSQNQVPLVTNTPQNNMTIPVATPVSLFPLTVFSAMPSTVSAGPKVARVAPVAPVAPTTVVSSTGLTRTVKVCVAEAPNLLEEPPLKKQREDVGLPVDYNMVRNNQFTSSSIVSCSLPSTMATSPSVTSATFNGVASLLPQKVVEQCAAPEVLGASPSVDALNGRLRISASQEVLSGSTVLTSQQLAVPPVSSPPQEVYQPLSQAVLQNIDQATTRHEAQGVSATQSTTQTMTQTTPMAALPQQAHTITQQLPTLPSGQMVDQHANQQPMNVQPNLPVPVSDPLLSQGTGLCGMLPNTSVVTPTSTGQEAISSTCVTSSALTRSDPLLSQSSPVTPMQMDSNTGIPSSRNEANNSRARADPLLAPNPTTTQVSMQNEVTSAINLSETELLNYFDPNCFDNV